MGAGWIRGSPCSGDWLHLVTAGKLLVGWVIGRYRDWEYLVKVVMIFRRANRANWGL